MDLPLDSLKELLQAPLHSIMHFQAPRQSPCIDSFHIILTCMNSRLSHTYNRLLKNVLTDAEAVMLEHEG